MNDGIPSISDTPRTVGFYIFPDFQILDLTGPLTAFQLAVVPQRAAQESNCVAGAAPYRLLVLSRSGGPIASTAGIDIATIAPDDRAIDTLMVAGGAGARSAHPDEPGAIKHLGSRARRVASVCTGAFLLAAAGLLDGRRATTHWRHATQLQRTYPRVKLEADRIFVRDGAVWTSAGITAGIDLALAMIEEDHGAGVARAAARELVLHHRRAGGQSQFSEMLALEPETDRIRRSLMFARENLGASLGVDRLAEIACLSPRQFSRAFRAETGESPAKAIERLRAEAARPRIEAGLEPIETIAAAVGFSDPERMRRAFLRRFGNPPQSLRRAARDSMRRVVPG